MGVLIRGASGSGKSDLALRMIDGGGRLVADDRVDLSVSDARDGARLVAQAPDILRGRIEVRGLGILRLPALDSVAVSLVVDLVSGDAIERLPGRRTCAYLEVELPLLALDPFEAAAAVKLRVAARHVSGDIELDDGS